LDVKFQISEYKVHQVDTKDFGSQKISFLAFNATSVASRKNLYNNGGNGRSKKMKISERKKIFFSTLNQFYPCMKNPPIYPTSLIFHMWQVKTVNR
jgi:hypothetical protein